MSTPAWWAFVGVVTAILLVLGYLLVDSKMPSTRLIAPPTLETPLVPGRGFSVAFSVEKLRQCPGDVAFFLIEERSDAQPPLVISLTRWPTRTFRRVGDSPRFALSGYLPRWVRMDRARVRVVARYHCGVGEQESVQDTAPTRIGPSIGPAAIEDGDNASR